MKIDAAIQSYRKPESLLYSLMCLHAVSRDHIETVFINDDCSGIDLAKTYLNARVTAYFAPWKIRCRVNTRPVRWSPAWVRGFRPGYISKRKWWSRWLRSLYRRRWAFHEAEDIRYEWAIQSTDKPHLYLLHDDMEYADDVVGLCLSRAGEAVALVGDLGQCWKCPHHLQQPACSPERIMEGILPSAHWPRTKPTAGVGSRECRINEWSCLLNVAVAREMAARERCFFGNYDDEGDVGAYWFEQVLRRGYRIEDPLPTAGQRARYYHHGWVGHGGHSVWEVQNGRQQTYDPGMIVRRTIERFGLALIDSGPAGAL